MSHPVVCFYNLRKYNLRKYISDRVCSMRTVFHLWDSMFVYLVLRNRVLNLPKSSWTTRFTAQSLQSRISWTKPVCIADSFPSTRPATISPAIARASISVEVFDLYLDLVWSHLDVCQNQTLSNHNKVCKGTPTFLRVYEVYIDQLTA